MTCIVGYAANNKIYMGADSLATDGNGYKFPRPLNKMLKLTQHNKGLLIGTAGSTIFSTLLKTEMLQSLTRLNEKNLEEWLFKNICKKLKQLGGAMELNPEDSQFSALVGSYGRLFEIAVDFDLLEIGNEKYYAIGSGALHALGAMYSIAEMGSITKKCHKYVLQQGLKAAEFYNSTVASPFYFEEL